MQPSSGDGPNALTILIGILVVILVGVLIIGVSLVSSIRGLLFSSSGENVYQQGRGTQSGEIVDCDGVDIPKEWADYVKESAESYLGSDPAKLMALIQIESGWNADAKNPGSSAAGLGQFITSTARGMKEFTGGNDRGGYSWSAGKVHDNPSTNPDDARFDPKRAIFASGDLFGLAVDRYGSIGEAYAQSYHGGARLGGKYAEEANRGRARLESAYQRYREGCKAVSTPAGSSTASESGQKIVEIAKQYVGSTTQINPRTGENIFNCSAATRSCASFVSFVLNRAGVTSEFQGTTTGVWSKAGGSVIIDRGQPFDVNKLQPGDVVWFGLGSSARYSNALFNHVGIYIGNGQIIDTSSSQRKVVQRPITVHTGNNRPTAAKRF